MDENNLNNDDLNGSLDESLDKHLSDEFSEEEDVIRKEEGHHAMYYSEAPGGRLFSIFLPGILVLFLLIGFTNEPGKKSVSYKTDGFVEAGLDDTTSRISKSGMVSASELRKPVMDTVYTDKDVWYELRVNEQYVYQHWRDGHTKKFPVSTGNKFISKGVEARPGLFAIFYRNPHHKSSQFDDASLFHFQTFNQGIGFHSLSGTGYYGNLGVRPSSHGCIRMSHSDAEQMFNDAEMGTLVLVHYDKYARTVGFAPKGFKGKEYTKEEEKKMLAQNLFNVLNGNYYVAERDFFVVDPKVIPVSGVYVGYDKKLPKTQKMPARLYYYETNPDKLAMKHQYENIAEEVTAESEFKLVSAGNNKKKDSDLTYSSDEELVKKFFSNPIGILPYFPPSPKKTTSYISSNTSTSNQTSTTPAPSSPGGDGE